MPSPLSKSAIHKILTGLNNRQKEAVCHTEGPVLIIAGAGSGKTRTLTRRLAYILSQNLVVGDKRALAITFTNKAAEEMEKRVTILLKDAGISPNQAPFIGTFHSFGAKILHSAADIVGRSRNYSIYDEEDALALIKRIMKELEIGGEKVTPAAIRHEISRLKNEIIEPSVYAAETSTPFEKAAAAIYARYEELLKEHNAFDFDDLIEKPVRIFRSSPAILARFQEEYPYVLVDEYQDTNVSQYQLIKLLAGGHQNICVVGDDAQSIYRWRGADFRNFLNFDRDWKDTKVVKLEQNYRSSKNILKAADGVISKNVLQKKKKLWTQNEGGSPVFVVETANEHEEARFVAGRAAELMSERGLNPKDIAVFYRTNAQARSLEEAFLEANIPYRIVGGVKFYERREIKDVLAYLRLCVNPDDRVSLERIINVPPRGISKERLRRLDYNLSVIPSLEELLDKLKTLAEITPATELIFHLVKAIDYQKYLEKEYLNADDRWENLMELLSLARGFDERLEPPRGLRAFLESVHLMQETDHATSEHRRLLMARNSETDAVSLMTIHCAKGLEFEVVFVAGCEEGLLPHARSLLDAEELEEERRLAYVAITRAKKELYLCFSRQRLLFGSREPAIPSQFIYDVPPEVTEFVAANKYDDEVDEDEEYIEY
ncbi:MAG: hypothetical protein A3J67_06670 [Parcubacteria group bacterium RIFCSPHIGHO2_02_FULL_48_10b]|nr:MAG: hypothetical protein A3J67_06670 [Parcubacteria group bacterium RIFCSPHIGHO2_02_FULL_48_10b]